MAPQPRPATPTVTSRPGMRALVASALMTTDRPGETAQGSAAGASAAASLSVGQVVTAIEARYPPTTAEAWDRVGLVVGELSAPVQWVLLAVDCVPETVDEAVAAGAQMMVVHHPLLLRGVHSVATTTYKGAVVHRLIRAGIALYVAHTNADVATPGVIRRAGRAARTGRGTSRWRPNAGHPGRVGQLPRPLRLADFAEEAARRLPTTAVGVRAAGDPDRLVSTVAVAGGAGDGFLAEVVAGWRGRVPHRRPAPPPGERTPRRRWAGTARRSTLGNRTSVARRARRTRSGPTSGCP